MIQTCLSRQLHPFGDIHYQNALPPDGAEQAVRVAAIEPVTLV